MRIFARPDRGNAEAARSRLTDIINVDRTTAVASTAAGVAEIAALGLARDGNPEPIHIEENETTFTIDWKGSYRIEGAAFVYMDGETGRLATIHGCPTGVKMRVFHLIRRIGGPRSMDQSQISKPTTMPPSH
jgi:hypothetical protein